MEASSSMHVAYVHAKTLTGERRYSSADPETSNAHRTRSRMTGEGINIYQQTPLDDLEPTGPLAGDGRARDRAALTEGQGLPALAEAPSHPDAPLED